MYLSVYKKGKILSDYDSTLMESYNFYITIYLTIEYYMISVRRVGNDGRYLGLVLENRSWQILMVDWIYS